MNKYVATCSQINARHKKICLAQDLSVLLECYCYQTLGWRVSGSYQPGWTGHASGIPGSGPAIQEGQWARPNYFRIVMVMFALGGP